MNPDKQVDQELAILIAEAILELDSAMHRAEQRKSKLETLLTHCEDYTLEQIENICRLIQDERQSDDDATEVITAEELLPRR